MTLRAAAVFLAILVAGPMPSWGQAAAPHLVINDTDVTLQATPFLQDGVLLLPADLVARAFGAASTWYAPTQTLVLTGASGRRVQLSAGDTRLDIDGVVRDLPAAPVVRRGTLWAPALAVLRGLGAYVVDADDAHTQIALAQVNDVAWRTDGGGIAVQITATGPVHVDPHVLHQPERLVLDLGGAVARLSTGSQDIGIAGVVRVRGGQFQVRPFITRIVFDLDRPMKFTVDSRPGEVALALGDAPPASAAHARPGSSQPPASAEQQPASHAASSSPTAVHAPPAAAAPPPQGAGPAASAPASGAAPQASTPASSPPPVPRGPAAASSAASTGSPGPADRRTPADAGSPAPPPEPLAVPPLPDFTDGPGAFHVQAVAYDDQDRTGRITIRTSQHLAYALRPFVYPDRLAIDISGGVYLPRRQDIEVGSDAVRNVLVYQFQLKPNVTRVLVHLNHKLPYDAAVADGGRTLIVTLGNPGRRVARGSAVIIDPGHGGSDGGATGPSGLREADVALAISRWVHDNLTARGIPSVMTRTDDSTVPLEERPDLAVRNGGILFVSIHANGSRSIGSAGTETYYETPDGQALARVMQSEVTQALGEPDRGIHTADFYVLVNTPMPAVLVETAFITNPSEEAMLRDPAVQQRVADAIARAIAKYLAAQNQPGSVIPDGPVTAGPAGSSHGRADVGRAEP